MVSPASWYSGPNRPVSALFSEQLPSLLPLDLIPVTSLICKFSVSFLLQFFNTLKELEKGHFDVKYLAALDSLSDDHPAFNLAFKCFAVVVCFTGCYLAGCVQYTFIFCPFQVLV